LRHFVQIEGALGSHWRHSGSGVPPTTPQSSSGEKELNGHGTGRNDHWGSELLRGLEKEKVGRVCREIRAGRHRHCPGPNFFTRSTKKAQSRTSSTLQTALHHRQRTLLHGPPCKITAVDHERHCKYQPILPHAPPMSGRS